MRSEDIMNGYLGNLLLRTTTTTTTTVVSGEGIAPEIPAKKSVIIRTRQDM